MLVVTIFVVTPFATAIIRAGGAWQVYSVGGAALFSVYLDHVVLARGGRFETLKLPKLLLSVLPRSG